MKTTMLFAASLLTAMLCAGCDLQPTPPEKVLSNAQIIIAKDECEKGGMGYIVLHYNGNPAFPIKVVCENMK